MMRALFCFFQFGGDNTSWCNQKCPYCYGGKKKMRHYWNGDVAKWEKAFERLNRDIYFVMSYGESMGMHGFYECVDMIGRHLTWTLNIVTNLSFSPERLIASRLGREKRVFINACWHPLGVKDRVQGWERFKRHLLMLKDAGIPLHVLFLWYKPQIKWFPEMFEWLDARDIRVSVRRYVGNIGGHTLRVPYFHKTFSVGGKNYPGDHTLVELDYLYASTCPKVIEYGVECASTHGKLCSASKDMILVKYDGTVGLCADAHSYHLGNLFDENFKLNLEPIQCPITICGGDYGMLHLTDDRFGSLPTTLWHDTFVSQVEEIPQTSPVAYPKRAEMLKSLELLKHENSKVTKQ
jgi:MoaA/NifB/PqqE/SkfB family radical SAM enzyme